MTPTVPETTLLDRARIEALFASDLSMSAPTDPAIVHNAIRNAVRRHGGTRGCAALVAQEVGDHPDTAVPRMRWARATVTTWYINARDALPFRSVEPLHIKHLVGAAK